MDLKNPYTPHSGVPKIGKWRRQSQQKRPHTYMSVEPSSTFKSGPWATVANRCVCRGRQCIQSACRSGTASAYSGRCGGESETNVSNWSIDTGTRKRENRASAASDPRRQARQTGRYRRCRIQADHRQDMVRIKVTWFVCPSVQL